MNIAEGNLSMKSEKYDSCEVVLFRTEDGNTSLEVQLEQETVWITQKQMSSLFDKAVPTINEHIKNIFKEDEMEKKSVIRKFRITAADGKNYETIHYNLDVIISVGYRVKPKLPKKSNMQKMHIANSDRKSDRQPD